MAYFDSPKNRALWDKELAELRKEKAARANNQGKTATDKKERADMPLRNADVNRIRTSYKELLAEESAAVRSRRTEKVSLQRQKDKAMSEPGLGSAKK